MDVAAVVKVEDSLGLRPYTAEAAVSLLPLTRVALGDSGAVRKTEDFWQWKHHANPFGESVGLYAWDEEAQRAAALRLLLRWQFTDRDGQTLHAARAVDTATHPEYQRQGLFTRLTLEAIDDLRGRGFDLIYNTPNAKSLPGYLKMGWSVVTAWPLFIKPLRPLRMIGRRLGKRAERPESGTLLHNFFGPGVLTWAEFHARFGDEVGEVVMAAEEVRTRIGLRTQRSTEYLAWRYGGHPHIDYGFFPQREAGKLVGFAVLRPNNRFGWQEIVLTELFCSNAGMEQGRRAAA